jgi:hypothetical protein
VILLIDKTWDGAPIGADEIARVELIAEPHRVVATVDAPFHGDPPPAGPPGPTGGLWEHEVVEIFLLGREDAYLEIELGPHGHHLALELRGARNVVRRGLPLRYDARIEGRRWSGIASIPRGWLPDGLDRGNAYAIHGTGLSRRHLAAFPVPGDRPDFHRLDAFGTVRLDGA